MFSRMHLFSSVRKLPSTSIRNTEVPSKLPLIIYDSMHSVYACVCLCTRLTLASCDFGIRNHTILCLCPHETQAWVDSSRLYPFLWRVHIAFAAGTRLINETVLTQRGASSNNWGPAFLAWMLFRATKVFSPVKIVFECHKNGQPAMTCGFPISRSTENGSCTILSQRHGKGSAA